MLRQIFVVLVRQVQPDQIARFTKRKRHAIADVVRLALQWNAVERNGYVIGFVISFPNLLW